VEETTWILTPRTASDSSGKTVPRNSENAAPEAAPLRNLAPAPVAFTAVPEIIDGQLFLYYTMENQGEATLLTDILRLRIFDHDGNWLAFKINRATRSGYIGRLDGNGVEYGFIGVESAEEILVFEWRLVTLGSGMLRLMRAEVRIP
jgi:hypothetical protein